MKSLQVRPVEARDEDLRVVSNARCIGTFHAAHLALLVEDEECLVSISSAALYFCMGSERTEIMKSTGRGHE